MEETEGTALYRRTLPPPWFTWALGAVYVGLLVFAIVEARPVFIAVWAVAIVIVLVALWRAPQAIEVDPGEVRLRYRGTRVASFAAGDLVLARAASSKNFRIERAGEVERRKRLVCVFRDPEPAGVAALFAAAGVATTVEHPNLEA